MVRTRMLRHFVALRKLDAFADGELAESQALGVVFHLDECVDCVTELDRVLWAKAVLAQYRRVAVPEDGAVAVARLHRWIDTEIHGTI